MRGESDVVVAVVTAVTASSWRTADELFACWRGAGNGTERDEGGGDGYGDDHDDLYDYGDRS